MLRAGRAAEPETLEIGVSGPEQRAEIEEIWRASFPEDSAAARALFLDRLLPCGYCLSGSVGGRPVTMAFLLPAELETGTAVLPLQYIFAAATLPACRGRGLFGRLLRQALERAREQGIAASFLRPAEPGLAAYYERFGYRPFFRSAAERVGRETFHPAGALPAGGFALLEDERNAAAFRNAALEGRPVWVRWPDELAALAADAAGLSGGGAFAGEGGFALCEPAGDTLFIRDWSCRPAAEKELRAAVAAHFPQREIALSRPAAPGEGEPFGWLCPLNGGRGFWASLEKKSPYLGLAFE